MLSGVIELTCNAYLCGVPGRRPRRYSFAWDKRVVRCQASTAEFVKLFDVQCSLTADCFLAEKDEARKDYMRSLAAKQGQHYEPGATVDLLDALPPAEICRYHEHMKLRGENQDVDGTYVFDVEQNPKFSRGCGLLPVIVCHGKLISASAAGVDHCGQGTVFTPNEYP